MDLETINQARQELIRFGERLIAADNALKADSLVSITGSKETAACKRASMDLTRALARLRGAK
tara:strand:+ start:8914 stop:9102 length:189 start_codon:yes stop_codon:yes gene_type:complete